MMNYIRLNDFTSQDIRAIYEISDDINSYKNQFQGKTFVLFFPESSIRTRLSFEKGINDLGGQCILFPPSTLDKREALKDVMAYIENWADAVIVRHKDIKVIEALAANSSIPVINAMTSENHPCEITSDIYGIEKLKGPINRLKVCLVGANNNISRSYATAAQVFGFKLHHTSYGDERIKADDEHYEFVENLDTALEDADVVLTDSLPSRLKTSYYLRDYQITKDKMALTNDGILNPCPPFFRGEEVSADVIDSDYFVGHQFKKDLLKVQQAIIIKCLEVK